ncbi:MAG: hypothetical protein PHS24_04655 [Bacilli bacterium]|nr:hypothetical protein [Bacilli bacterium]
MFIDINNLSDEINQMITKLRIAKTESEQSKIYDSLINLSEVYYLLTGYDYDANYFKIASDRPLRKVKKIGSNNIIFDNIKDSYYLDASKNILTIYRDTNFKTFHYEDRKIFKMSDGLDIIYDFFNKYNHKYYKLIKDMIYHNQVATKPIYDNFKGICYNISVLKKSYIICNIKNINIYDLSSLIHEFGHAIYSNEVDNVPQQKSINHFHEVSSMYFMKLFLNYSFENNLSNSDTIIAYNLFYRALLNRFIGVRYYTDHKLPKTIVDLKLLPKDIDIALLQTKSNNITLDKNDNLNYAYGSLIALYFADQYKNDSQETRINFINFISKIGKISNKEMLNICGLNQKELANPKVLKKELKNHVLNKW